MLLIPTPTFLPSAAAFLGTFSQHMSRYKVLELYLTVKIIVVPRNQPRFVLFQYVCN